jgi:hypothetical protein
MKTWEYLTTEPFKLRQKSILHFLTDIDTIIEIGPGQVPMSEFVTEKTVVLVEPNFTYGPQSTNQVIHIHKDCRDITTELDAYVTGRYAFIIFGIDYVLTPKLQEIAGNAHVCIIETTNELDYHMTLMKNLKAWKAPTYEYEFKVLSKVTVSPDSWPPRPGRIVFVWTKT